MSDLTAGRATGARGGGQGPFNGGAPPPVLLVALGAAAVLAVTFLVLFGAFAGGDDVGAAPDPAGNIVQLDASGLPERVTLTVTLQGSGGGAVLIRPGEIRCRESCEHRFDSGTHLTLTADAGTKSTFAGWEGGCEGSGRCSIVIAGDQAVTATFDRRPVAPPPDDDPVAGDDEAGAGDSDDLDAADGDDLDGDEGDTPGPDCADGRDNDGDGLTDTAQDPDCVAGGSESGAPAPQPPPPPPARAADDCGDGRDNDGDGLTDTAQDPDCLAGSSESGRPAGGASGTPRAPSECRDRKDNDGDGLIDTAQDPGCENDSTEAD